MVLLFQSFLELLLAMTSRELRLEVCWDRDYTQDFPTSEAFTCKVTWFFFWFALDCLFQGVFAQRYSPVIVGCYHYAWHTHQSMEGYSPLDKLSEDEMAFLYTSKSTFNALDASLRNQRTVEECLGEAQASWYRVAILRCMQLLHTGNCLFGFGKFPS